MASASASTSPAGTSQPCSPGAHQLRDAGDVGADHRPAQRHRLHDARPAGLRRSSAAPARGRPGSRRAPRSLLIQPVMRTLAPQAEHARSPPRSRRASRRRRRAPARSPCRAVPACRAASTSSSCPFCSQSRPTHTSRRRRRSRSAGRARSSRLEAAVHHLDLGPVRRAAPAVELAAAVRADRRRRRRARRTFSARPISGALSNSSGPCTVKLYGGPPSSCASIATSAGLVPKCACRCWTSAAVSHGTMRQASAR